MDFLILNKNNIRFIAKNISMKHIIISITSEGCDFPEIEKSDSCSGILKLVFDDIDTLRYAHHGKLFDRSMAQKILNFVEKHKNDIHLIICQCEGGISRSAGVAVGLTYLFNERARRDIIYQHYIPNALVVNTLVKEIMEK